MNAKGQVFASTGYEEGGPANYLKSLAKFLKNNTDAGVKKFADSAAAEAKQSELNEALDGVIGPFIDKKDYAGAEAALAKFMKDKGVTGEAATRMNFNARMGIAMASKPGDHEAVIKLIDATLAKDSKSDFAAELKGLRERVEKVRDQQAGAKK